MALVHRCTSALAFGSGAEVGVRPAKEYTFLVFVTLLGPYFKEGFNPVKIAIIRDSDRAAPLEPELSRWVVTTQQVCAER